jgi:hypothetical protein
VAIAADPQLYRIEQDGLYGFIDSTGRVIIAPRFVWVTGFQEGRAVAMVCGGDAYIDVTGEIVEGPSSSGKGRFSEGLAPFWRHGKAGFRDLQGNVVIPSRFEDIADFSDEIAPVQVKGKWGYIDRKGKFLLDPQFEMLSPFHEGYAFAQTTENEIVFLNRRFERVFKGAEWISLLPSEELLAFNDDGRHGYARSDGSIAITPRYERAKRFSEGLAPASLEGRMGFIDKSGQFVIAARFDDAKPFANGLAAVRLGDAWGYVDHSGKMAIPLFEAEWVSDFDENGVAGASDDSGSGYISRSGQRIWWGNGTNIFDHAPLFGFSKAWIKKSCEGNEKKYSKVLRKALKEARE